MTTNKSQISAAIRSNLAAEGILDADVRVQPDPYSDSGWRIAVITDSFQNMPIERRTEIVFESDPVSLDTKLT